VLCLYLAQNARGFFAFWYIFVSNTKELKFAGYKL
jgi:hypothetical protein